MVIKGVDREKMVTVDKIAVPLKVSAAMAAEIVGVCVLTSVLDLIFCKNLSVQNINQRINRKCTADCSCFFDYLKTS